MSKGCVNHHRGRTDRGKETRDILRETDDISRKWMHVRDEKMNNNNNNNSIMYVYARAFTPLRSSSIYAPDLSMSFSANGFATVWYPLVQSAPG